MTVLPEPVAPTTSVCVRRRCRRTGRTPAAAPSWPSSSSPLVAHAAERASSPARAPPQPPPGERARAAPRGASRASRGRRPPRGLRGASAGRDSAATIAASASVSDACAPARPARAGRSRAQRARGSSGGSCRRISAGRREAEQQTAARQCTARARQRADQPAIDRGSDRPPVFGELVGLRASTLLLSRRRRSDGGARAGRSRPVEWLTSDGGPAGSPSRCCVCCRSGRAGRVDDLRARGPPAARAPYIKLATRPIRAAAGSARSLTRVRPRAG